MKSTLVAIVGMPGAGKSMAAEFFRAKGVPVLRFGDAIEEGVREFGMEVNEKNERAVREKIRKELGMAAVAKKIEPRINDAKKTNTLIVLDGLYSWEEYVYLKKKFPQFLLLCIFAPPQTRYARLERRAVRPLTKREAAGRDISEIENLNKGGPIARADYLIKNDSTPQALIAELEKYFSTLT